MDRQYDALRSTQAQFANDRRERVETEALRRVEHELAAAGQLNSAGLMLALEHLDALGRAAGRAYDASDSPADSYGNPTDYSGDAHQTLLRCHRIGEQFESTAELLRKLLTAQAVSDGTEAGGS